MLDRKRMEVDMNVERFKFCRLWRFGIPCAPWSFSSSERSLPFSVSRTACLACKASVKAVSLRSGFPGTMSTLWCIKLLALPVKECTSRTFLRTMHWAGWPGQCLCVTQTITALIHSTHLGPSQWLSSVLERSRLRLHQGPGRVAQLLVLVRRSTVLGVLACRAHSGPTHPMLPADLLSCSPFLKPVSGANVVHRVVAYTD